MVLANGQVVHCHVDHLRRNRTAEIETPKSLDDPEAVVPDHGGSDPTETQDCMEIPPDIIWHKLPGVGAGVKGCWYPSTDLLQQEPYP